MTFFDRQAAEGVIVFCKAVETLGIRNGRETTVQAVTPGMKRTGKLACLTLTSLDYPGTPVTTHIDQCMQLVSFVTSHDHRQPTHDGTCDESTRACHLS